MWSLKVLLVRSYRYIAGWVQSPLQRVRVPSPLTLYRVLYPIEPSCWISVKLPSLNRSDQYLVPVAPKDEQ